MTDDMTETIEPSQEQKTQAAEQPEETSPQETGPAAAADSNQNSKDDPRDNQNRVFLRGVIRGIRQELDSEDRQTNVISLTTPNPLSENRIGTGLLDVYWGSNTRASEILADFRAGDHVVIDAECRTFRTSLLRGEVLYGISITRDKPSGITGMGDYEPDRNEALFIGTLRSVQKVSERMDLLHLVVHTRTDKRDITSYPMAAMYGRVRTAFRQHASDLEVGKRIGLACHIQLRPDKTTGTPKIRWQVHGLMRIGENGQPVTIRIPQPYSYRAPRNNSSRASRQHTVRSSAAEDLNTLSKETEEEHPEGSSVADIPALEADHPADPENEEVIEYHPADRTAEVLTNDKIRSMATQQALDALNSMDDTV